MKILDYLEDNLLIITEKSYQEVILKEMNNNDKLYDIKFMSLDEYKKNYLFDYDVKTIYYLVNKYHLKVGNVIELINNLYFIDNRHYNSDKLNYLVKIKNELDSLNLLIYNPYFQNYLNHKKIIVYNYYYLDKFSLNILTNSSFVNDDYAVKKYDLYEFNDIQEEVEFVFNEIYSLLLKGVDINKIKLLNVKDEYIPYLKKFAIFYNLSIDLPSNSLYGVKLVNDFLKLIKDGKTRDEICLFLEKYHETKIYGILINLINKYSSFDNLSMVYELLVDDVKRLTNPKIEYTNVLTLIDFNSYVASDEYVFLMGYNVNNIPRLYKDEDYIEDVLKNEVIMSDTDELNLISNSNTRIFLYKINNLIISYKLKTPYEPYLPANLFDDFEIIKTSVDNYNYSLLYNKLKYASYLDNYVKYGEYNQNFGFLYYNYRDNNYNTYNNDYKPIKKESLLEYLDNQLTLSYSSLDNYYKCAFRYYLSNILKIDLYEETFYTIVGNLFHYVLSKAFTTDFSFDLVFNSFLKDYNFNKKEMFFINKLKSDLLFIIQIVNEYRMNTGLTNELYEKKIEIPLLENPKVTYKGFVDKIMYKEKDGMTYVAIVDYKTGNPLIKLNDLPHGLSMQLPSYLYLVSKSNLFNNMKVTGFYLQHILDNEIKIDRNKDYITQKKDNLKLMGYSSNDINRLAMFDASYENSMMIKGMKMKADGMLAVSANALSDREIDNIINLCEEKIKSAVNDILNANFNINPKVINKENKGCQYCHFYDICYRNEKDLMYLEEGDKDA